MNANYCRTNECGSQSNQLARLAVKKAMTSSSAIRAPAKPFHTTITAAPSI